ncbi:MAG: serine/threonine-protein kinase [Nannocystaceae bacterium]
MTSTAEDATQTPWPALGELVDERFEVRALLGDGGMGRVFRAFDRTLGCDVALKLLVPRYVGRVEREERFLRELELGQRVPAHPHLVEMLDGGRLSETGRPFLVMTLVEGRVLSHRLALGPLPPHVGARVARQVAGAVRALHRHGVVHRDITPMNVLMDGHEAVLIDLSHAGDASAPRLAAGDAGRLTRKHEVPGTHQYMAPEQARAEPAQLAMDVYAFGITLAQILVGLAMERYSREAFLQLQREAKVKPPRVDTRIHTMVPRRLAQLVDACTATVPEQRPSMDEVVQWIDEVLASMSIPADTSGQAPVGGQVDGPKRVGARGPSTSVAAGAVGPRASRAFVVAGAVLACLTGLGLVGWWYRAVPAVGPVSATLSQWSDRGFVQAPVQVPAPVPVHIPSRSVAPVDAPPAPARETSGAPARVEHRELVDDEYRTRSGLVARKDQVRRPELARRPRGSVAGLDPEPPAAAVLTAEHSDCATHRSKTDRAVASASWTSVVELARLHECWEDRTIPKRLQIRALFETRAWKACVDEGHGVREPRTKQWVELCQRHLR